MASASVYGQSVELRDELRDSTARNNTQVPRMEKGRPATVIASGAHFPHIRRAADVNFTAAPSDYKKGSALTLNSGLLTQTLNC